MICTLYVYSYYCKRGYFCWGKISRKCWQDISRGGNFHDTAYISFIKAYGFYFRVGVIFAKKTKAKNAKITPTQNFPRLQYLMNEKINIICFKMKRKMFKFTVA